MGNSEACREGSYGRVLYNRFRYYDPSIGRYISADPLGQHVDPNLYAYVGNSPTNAIDPLGLYTWADARSDAAFFARNSAQGLAAAADGAIPFFDPFAGAGAYDPCDPTLAGSRTAGAATAAALAALAGYGAANGFGALSGAGLADAVATAVGAGASESFGTDDIGAGSYDQPNGDRTDIRQQEDHGAGVTHTHEQTYNTAPSGERFPAGRTQPGRPVSSRDANNIRSGRATRSSPRGR